MDGEYFISPILFSGCRSLKLLSLYLLFGWLISMWLQQRMHQCTQMQSVPVKGLIPVFKIIWYVCMELKPALSYLCHCSHDSYAVMWANELRGTQSKWQPAVWNDMTECPLPAVCLYTPTGRRYETGCQSVTFKSRLGIWITKKIK